MLNPILASSGLRRMRSGKTLLLLAIYESVLLLEGQTGMLQNRLASGWGRPYAMCLMLKKLGYTASALSTWVS